MAWNGQEGRTVYLTKLMMPLTSRAAAMALGDCQRMHRLVSGLFGAQRQEDHVLYRISPSGGSIRLYLYSDGPVLSLPDQVQLEGQRELSDWLEGMKAGACFGFDLLASPCKKVYQEEYGRNSQRRVLREPQERMDWLQRKAERNGFRILNVQEMEQSHSYGKHSQEKGGSMYLDAYHYQGTLGILDAEKFVNGLKEGIGPGKAYGLGMLMLRSL